MTNYEKTVRWWSSKAATDQSWESLSDQEKVEAAWTASQFLRVDVVDIGALDWAYQKLDSYYGHIKDDDVKREFDLFLSRIRRMRNACRDVT